ncbi:unnamed protein product [Blepharisma stoltei]|uniref:non-specific serine/threonine protein kinase n=1 Tax=Blepharisma stoltei TaxID=1481888 RepID=A0AAU9IEQ4_9CILI|nr:unnamed protein product [Blepharisma stoltei]
MSFTSKYQELEPIGRTEFRSVYRVQHKVTNDIYAAKKICLMGLDAKEIQYSYQEAKVLHWLHHPNIVQYIESFVENNELIIVMEYCEGGDLAHQIKSHKERNMQIPIPQIISWFVQVACSLQYLHKQRILHRDIKASNIYLTKDLVVKIGDFGISKMLEHTNDVACTVVGTPYYMSPEVCQNKPYTNKSDIWSLGCLLYELCNLRFPFVANNLLTLITKILNEPPDPLDADLPNELGFAIKSMLVKDMSARASLAAVLNLPIFFKYIQEYNWTINVEKSVERFETPTERLRRRKREEAEKKALSSRPSSTSTENDSLKLFHHPDSRVSENISDFNPLDLVESDISVYPLQEDHEIFSYSTNPLIDSNATEEYEDDFESDTEEHENIKEEIEEDISLRNTLSASSSMMSEDISSIHRQRAIEALGANFFERIYRFLKSRRDMKVPDDVIYGEVERNFGKNAVNNLYLVDQVIFYENPS